MISNYQFLRQKTNKSFKNDKERGFKQSSLKSVREIYLKLQRILNHFLSNLSQSGKTVKFTLEIVKLIRLLQNLLLPLYHLANFKNLLLTGRRLRVSLQPKRELLEFQIVQLIQMMK